MAAENQSDRVYDEIGVSYSTTRRPDPRIERRIVDALGDAGSVVNVGAGAGAYEPGDRDVLAVEPSAVMRAQRPAGAARCIEGRAEALPLADRSFDAAMTLLSLHHWKDWRAGVAELRRVARTRIVIFTYDPAFAGSWWLKRDYLSKLVALDIARFPTIAEQAGAAERARWLRRCRSHMTAPMDSSALTGDDPARTSTRVSVRVSPPSTSPAPTRSSVGWSALQATSMTAGGSSATATFSTTQS